MEAKLRQITLELPREADCHEVGPWQETLVRRAAIAGVTLVHPVTRSTPSRRASRNGSSSIARARNCPGGAVEGASCASGTKAGGRATISPSWRSRSPSALMRSRSDPKTCWNLAATGERCVAATLSYLRSIRVEAGRFAVEFEAWGRNERRTRRETLAHVMQWGPQQVARERPTCRRWRRTSMTSISSSRRGCVRREPRPLAVPVRDPGGTAGAHSSSSRAGCCSSRWRK